MIVIPKKITNSRSFYPVNLNMKPTLKDSIFLHYGDQNFKTSVSCSVIHRFRYRYFHIFLFIKFLLKLCSTFVYQRTPVYTNIKLHLAVNLRLSMSCDCIEYVFLAVIKMNGSWGINIISVPMILSLKEIIGTLRWRAQIGINENMCK